MSIRKSMYVTVSTMILVPFLLFTLLISAIFNDRLQLAIEDSLQAVSNAQIEEMTSFCEQQMNELVMLGNTSVFRAALKGDLDRATLDYVDNMLYERVQVTDYLNTSALINTDFQVVACSEDVYDSQAEEGFDSLSACVGEDGFYISNVLNIGEGEKAHQAVISIAAIEEDGNTLGYILAEISLDFYNSIRQSSMQRNDATFYLLDGNGKIISAGTAEDQRTSFITTKEERADYNAKYSALDFETEPKGSFTFRLSGKNYITYYSDIEYTKWQVMLTVNLDEYQAGGTVYAVGVCFLAVLCLAMSIWIGLFTARRLVKPIRHISETLRDIREKQDYSLRIGTGRKDELGILSEEVDQLLDFVETENLDKARKQRILEAKSEHDALTKVMNKPRIEQQLRDMLEQCRQQKGKLAVLFVDIDDFKAFNTKYGHSVGDQVLQFFAALITRKTRGVVGRVGGDEFLILIDHEKVIDELPAYLELLLQHSERHFVVRGGGQVPVACCIGAVKIDFSKPVTEQFTGEILINLADRLMYQAKNSGKCGYVIRDYDKIETESNA